MKNWDSMFLLAGPLEGWKLCRRDQAYQDAGAGLLK